MFLAQRMIYVQGGGSGSDHYALLMCTEMSYCMC
jgi:hypothetical protein